MAEEEQKRESVDDTGFDEEKATRRQFEDYVEDPVTDRRITRKFDLHILPWIFILWLLAFIDRSNIGELSALRLSLR